MRDILNYDEDCFCEFEKLARGVHKELYIFLYSMCEDNYIVKDAIRGALIKGYKSFHTFENTEEFKSWIFRMGNLEMNKIIEKNKEYHRKTIEITEHELNKKKIQEKEKDKLLKKDTKEMIMEAIESLNIDLREIIILKYYYKLSLEKIAEIQGTDVNTIDSNHMSAKWAIKDYLCKAFSI